MTATRNPHPALSIEKGEAREWEKQQFSYGVNPESTNSQTTVLLAANVECLE